MTGFMPGVIVKNITPGSNDPAIVPIGVIFHVAVSESDSLYDFFAHRSGGIESHFYVRNDGTIEQYRSIFFEADAQCDGNSFIVNGQRQGFISVETEGMGTGTWSTAQIASLKKIVEWVHSQHAFPYRKTPAWNQGGVGYHALFTQWNPDGHTCPGAGRIDQFESIFVPWLNGKTHHARPTVHLSNLKFGKRNADVVLVKKHLKHRGFFNGKLSKFFGIGLKRAYRKWQRHLGYVGKDADGRPGTQSLHRLGFRVVK